MLELGTDKTGTFLKYLKVTHQHQHDTGIIKQLHKFNCYTMISELKVYRWDCKMPSLSREK